MKERFSISLEAETRNKIDALVASKKEFANRSQAIDYCINTVLELETKDKNNISFLLDFLDVLEEQPGLNKKLRQFLRDEKEQEKNKN